MLDTLMQPVLDRLLTESALKPGTRILDIGCGTGASTMAAARLVAPDGHVTGADISDIMLALARERTDAAGLENVTYLEGDAQTFPLGEAAFDTVISRFGVMFFDDPVAAFRNIAGAVRPGGRMVFLAWGALADNPWFALPRQAAVDVLGTPPPVDPHAPGPMAFSDKDYVAGILRDAGWRDVDIPDVSVELTPRGGVSDVAAFATQVGPASRIIKDLGGTADDAAKIETRVTKAMTRFDTGAGIRVPATLNLVRAMR